MEFNPFDALGLDPSQPDLHKASVLQEAYWMALRHVTGDIFHPPSRVLAFPQLRHLQEARAKLTGRGLLQQTRFWGPRHRSTWNPRAPVDSEEAGRPIPGLEKPPRSFDGDAVDAPIVLDDDEDDDDNAAKKRKIGKQQRHDAVDPRALLEAAKAEARKAISKDAKATEAWVTAQVAVADAKQAVADAVTAAAHEAAGQQAVVPPAQITNLANAIARTKVAGHHRYGDALRRLQTAKAQAKLAMAKEFKAKGAAFKAKHAVADANRAVAQHRRAMSPPPRPEHVEVLTVSDDEDTWPAARRRASARPEDHKMLDRSDHERASGTAKHAVANAKHAVAARHHRAVSPPAPSRAKPRPERVEVLTVSDDEDTWPAARHGSASRHGSSSRHGSASRYGSASRHGSAPAEDHDMLEPSDDEAWDGLF
ncbi:MAG: hypothetical protein M1826_000225 [Phylliscum demangeonii]|nr:MAG: hypothetical protein M1826_000225 [Phylliscum demangeonii]